MTTGERLIKIAFLIHQFEVELCRAANQRLGTGTILKTGDLHQHTARTLFDDHRLGGTQRIDTVTHHLNDLIHCKLANLVRLFRFHR